MKSITYPVVTIFTLACFALAQQAPDSVAYNSNPSSLQLRARQEPNNTVILTWKGDPTSPGFNIYESIGDPYHFAAIITVGHVQSCTLPGFGCAVPIYFRVCDRLDPQTCSNDARVRCPR